MRLDQLESTQENRARREFPIGTIRHTQLAAQVLGSRQSDTERETLQKAVTSLRAERRKEEC